jgi:iron(III) transport system permease protein
MTSTLQDVRESLPRDRGIAAWLNVNVRFWRAASLAVAAVVAAPIIVVAAGWASPATDVWSHLLDTVLIETLRNTVGMLLGVGLGVLVVGVALAWLTTMCDFPGRRWFDWALVLPLALPAYVLAFVAIGLLD